MIAAAKLQPPFSFLFFIFSDVLLEKTCGIFRFLSLASRYYNSTKNPLGGRQRI